MVTADVAMSKIRQLSSTENFPFHPEGEARLARVLIENCAGVTHAQQVIDEFDEAEKCPTVEALRAAARRLAEVCECGKAKWQHREGVACKRFNSAAPDEWKKTEGGYSKFRQSVPLVPGVPWEVCLQVETIRIHLGKRGTPQSSSIATDYERFPQAVEALGSDRDPDYVLLESQMKALFPKVYRRSKESRRDFATLATDRLKDLEKPYAVESITSES